MSALVALATTLASGEKARFDNYRIYNVKIDNTEQLHQLQEIDMHLDGVSRQLFAISRRRKGGGESDKCKISN